MRENTISYEDKLNTLRQENDDYRRMVRREMLSNIELRDEIRALRAENARLAELVDARFTEDDWFESFGTE